MTYEDMTESQKRALFDAAVKGLHEFEHDGDPYGAWSAIGDAIADAIAPPVIASDKELESVAYAAYEASGHGVHRLRAIAADTWKRAAKEARKARCLGLAQSLERLAAQALKGRP